jgi:hypothetical protein
MFICKTRVLCHNAVLSQKVAFSPQKSTNKREKKSFDLMCDAFSLLLSPKNWGRSDAFLSPPHKKKTLSLLSIFSRELGRTTREVKEKQRGAETSGWSRALEEHHPAGAYLLGARFCKFFFCLVQI